LLQGRDPGHLNRRCQNPLAQSRDLLYLREQHRRNRVNGLITHVGLVKYKSSYWSSAPSCKLQAAVQEGPGFLYTTIESGQVQVKFSVNPPLLRLLFRPSIV